MYKRQELVRKFSGLREYNGVLYQGWHGANMWWNERVRIINDGGQAFKRRQLYLWGGKQIPVKVLWWRVSKI